MDRQARRERAWTILMEGALIGAGWQDDFEVGENGESSMICGAFQLEVIGTQSSTETAIGRVIPRLCRPVRW